MKDDRDLILRPRKRRLLFLLLGSLVFVASGIFILKSPTPSYGNAIASWSAVVFSGACALVAMVSLWPGSTYLTLGKTGFTVCMLFRPKSYRWSEVGSFKVGRMFTRKMVAFDYSNSYRLHRSLRKLNSRIGGFEASLPDFFGNSAEELAALLNEWRMRSETAT